MGSYDTGETYTPEPSPVRRMVTDDAPATRPRVRRTAVYEPGLPILISLGGGLTPARIVKKLPEEYATKPLSEVVSYVLGAENITTPEEQSIAEAVRQRMGQRDYRVVINNSMNYHNERLGSDTLGDYLVKDQRETESGNLAFNKVDFAIVSQDEGGRGNRTLEQMVR
jgi:hypothetical protein